MVKTKNTVSTHKQLNLNCSVKTPKSLMCGSFNVQPTSVGHVSQEAVKRYILEQEGKDVFEYSVFGSPNQKIGQFTQTKMGDFNA